MPDITSIAAILTSIKTATDIAKLLRESDLSLERAELKLKLADIIGTLAEAKIELAEVQETLANKDKRINELEEAFQSKDNIVRHLDAFYNIDADGNPIGNPFCLKCWENDHKKRQLVYHEKDLRVRVCASCGHRYEAHLAPELKKTEK